MSESDKPEENTPQPPTPEEVAEQGGRGEPQDPNGPVNTDYQDTDIHLNTVKKFVAASFAVTLGFFVLMLIVHRFYKRDYAEERGVATPEGRQIPGKDDSLLQTDELEDLEAYQAREEERLNTTTNAMAHAVIPVESAKKLMMREGFPNSQVAMDGEEPSAEAPEEDAGASGGTPMVAKADSGSTSPGMSASASKDSSSASEPRTLAVATRPTDDPAFVTAGEKIWKQQCMAACHTGKRGAIGPNIEKAYGSMRQLENGEEILMDEAYVINSMNHPKMHIAKGYMPVMNSFQDLLTETQKKQVAAYLRSQGKPIPVAQPEPEPEPAPKEMTAPKEMAEKPAPMAEPMEKAEPEPEGKPEPKPQPTPAPAVPAPAPEPEPKQPKGPPGTIFV